MKLSVASCIAAFLATGVLSVRISEQKSAFAKTCTNIRLQWARLAPWLVADCLTGNGDERITSTVFLLSKIKDNDGGYPNIDLKASDASRI